jgi:hypothetical protein
VKKVLKMAYNWKFYVENEDLDGAYDRYCSTTNRWKSYWFDVCNQIFQQSKEWAKKYIIDPVKQSIEIRVAQKRERKNYDIQIKPDFKNESNQKCYLFRFFNAEGERICSKIGTTTRDVMKRMREELSSPTYTRMGAVRAVVDRVYDCGNIPAEGLESYFRAEYIKQFPNSFKKNDRFINEDFDLAQADEIAKNYLGLA